MKIFLWKWTNSVLFFLPPPPRTREQCVLHLVPGGIIWCLFKANHGHQSHHLCCPLPGAASGEEEKNKAGTLTIKYSALSVLEPGGFYCQRCSDDTQRDRSGPKTTIKLWLFSNEAPYALLFCSVEDFSSDYELSLQSDFWMSEWVSEGSESASFTQRWEKLWIPVRKVMKVQLNLLTTLCWSRDARGDEIQRA